MSEIVKLSGAYPMHRCKVVHLVRHGQATHNKARLESKDEKIYESEEYFDAPLTPLGWQQAQYVKEHNAITNCINPQVIIVSPLTRCLQTAIGVFAGTPLQQGEDPSNALMLDGVTESRNGISASGLPPFVAVEWCREHMGVHPCDRRRPISILQSQYPAIDFTNLAMDQDVYWKKDHRETDDEVKYRTRVFANWLLNLTEVRIAVVAHSGFIWDFTRLFGEDCSAKVRKELQEGYANCEMRSIVIVDKFGIGQPFSKTDFPGCSKKYTPGQ